MGYLDSIEYTVRQFGGFMLGTTAVLGTALTYNEQDDWRVQKTALWALVAFIALIIHEMRPYKRSIG